jgi:putative restriction endonuclease
LQELCSRCILESVQYLKSKSATLISPHILTFSPEHLEALEWFDERKGMVVRWPTPLPSGIFLVNKAKGIHKPAGSDYALSVRESLASPYADQEPVFLPDGSWTYRYFQEEQDSSKRDTLFTNRALLACQRDGIPIGVMRQTKGKPNSQYQILGLALVREWQNGYFNLEGLSADSWRNVTAPIKLNNDFNPLTIEDARRKAFVEIVRRQGQGKFRQTILDAYGSCCAVSDCDSKDALEAAHIYGYLGAATNVVTNGLLLRGDIHTLYDLGHLAVEPDTLKVKIAPKLEKTVYRQFSGITIRSPDNPDHKPNKIALNLHLEWAKKRWAGKLS